MESETWKRRIGDEGFAFVTEGLDASTVSTVLTRMYEIGWRGQEDTPKIDPRGTKVLWPSADGENIAVLTTEGLIQFYNKQNSKWFLLRMEQLLRSCGGPLAGRLQEVLAAYEDQCQTDGVDPVPDWADAKPIVGGEAKRLDADAFISGLQT